ncbi:MAG: hypothetical protein ACKOYM_09265 [Actinomycetes bacterium]
MILVRHALRLVRSVVHYGVAEHRLSFILAVLLGAVAVVLVLVSHVVAPFVFYPFA